MADDLVGRAGETARLEEFLGAAGGRAALCLVGDPGVGRTALLDATVTAARRRGRPVHRAAGVPLEADLPWATLHQLMFPLLGASDTEDGPDAVIRAAFGLATRPPIGRATLATAVVDLLAPDALIVVDDLQSVDDASRAALADLVGRVGLLTATQETSPGLPIPVLEVTPLGPAEATRLVAGMPETQRHAVLNAARGNPGALRELAAAADGSNRPTTASVRPPGRLRRAYAAQLAKLPPATRRRLIVAALVDGPDVDVPGLVPELAAAIDAGLLIAEPAGRPRFRNPLLRAAVLAAAATQDRLDAHHELIDRYSAYPLRRAWHQAEATLRPDEAVADPLEEYARRALREGRTYSAVTALRRAADLSTTTSGRARRLARAAYLGLALEDRPDLPELLDAARAAAPPGPPALPLATVVADALVDDGAVEAAYRLLGVAVEAAGPTDPDLVDALYGLVGMARRLGHDDAWRMIDAALDRLGGSVPAELVLWAHGHRGPQHFTKIDLAVLEAAVQGIDEELDPARVCRIGFLALVADRGTACLAALRRVADGGRAGGALRFATSAVITMGLIAFEAGRWDEARAWGAEAVALGNAAGRRQAARTSGVIELMLAAATDDDDAVREGVQQMTAWAAPRGLGDLLSWAHRIEGTAAVGRGEFEDAYEHLAAVVAPFPFAVRTGYDTVEALVRTGRTDVAVAYVESLRAGNLDAVSDRLALLLAGTSAVVSDEAEAYEAALALPAAGHWPWDSARLQLLYGERLRRARANSRARPHLTAALDEFHRLGATRWADRAARELKATAVRRASGPHPAHLTPQEREVAELVAAGLTNKQVAERLVLSPRTVAAHLRQTYRKLRISSRGALGDALAS